MASVTATILIDQADDPEVRFSTSHAGQSVELDLCYRTAPVATVAFVSDRDAAERFALWLESVATLVRNEAELRDRDDQLCASDDAQLDRMIWGD